MVVAQELRGGKQVLFVRILLTFSQGRGNHVDNGSPSVARLNGDRARKALCTGVNNYVKSLPTPQAQLPRKKGKSAEKSSADRFRDMAYVTEAHLNEPGTQ